MKRILAAASVPVLMTGLALQLSGCKAGKDEAKDKPATSTPPKAAEAKTPPPAAPSAPEPAAPAKTTANPPPAAAPAPAPAPAPAAAPAKLPGPVTPAPGWVKYTISKDKLPDSMKEKFVGFTFNYPEKFVVMPDTTNFIKVEEKMKDPEKGDFTLENFAVGNMSANLAPSSMEQDLLFPMLLEQMETKIAAGFPGYKKAGEVMEEVAGVKGRALTFQAELKNTPRGDITLYGKVLLARPPGKERGVSIIMLATSLDPDVKSPADVGVKGDMGQLLKTFRFTDE